MPGFGGFLIGFSEVESPKFHRPSLTRDASIEEGMKLTSTVNCTMKYIN